MDSWGRWTLAFIVYGQEKLEIDMRSKSLLLIPTFILIAQNAAAVSVGMVAVYSDGSAKKLLAKKPKIELPTTKRIQWPDKKALAKLVWEKSLVHASAEIGVSDVALKKRCVKLGIELPPRGHWLRH